VFTGSQESWTELSIAAAARFFGIARGMVGVTRTSSYQALTPPRSLTALI